MTDPAQQLENLTLYSHLQWYTRVKFRFCLAVIIFAVILKLFHITEFPFLLFCLAPLFEILVNQPFSWLSKVFRRPDFQTFVHLFLNLVSISWAAYCLQAPFIHSMKMFYVIVLIYSGILLNREYSIILANLAFLLYVLTVSSMIRAPFAPALGITSLHYYLVFVSLNLTAVFVTSLSAHLREHAEQLKSSARNFLSEIDNHKQVEKLLENLNKDLTRNSETFRTMLVDLQKHHQNLKNNQDQLIRLEKMSAIGQLASGVAHEVKNPLAVILQGVEYLNRKMAPLPTDLDEVLTMMKNNVKQADHIVQGLVDFSKAERPKMQPEDVHTIISEALDLLKNEIISSNVQIEKAFPSSLPPVFCDRENIKQVFLNIIRNAIQSMPAGGNVRIRTSTQPADPGLNRVGKRCDDNFAPGENLVVVDIEDEGIGMPKLMLTKIFEPFFTTKGPDIGIGLGLSVAQNIIDRHRGYIDVKSVEEHGTTFSIGLKIIPPKNQKEL